jgi:hypothetical protein
MFRNRLNVWLRGKGQRAAGIAFVSILFAIPVQAAVVSGSVVQQEIQPNDVLEVSFFLDTQGEDVNAIEGTVVVPPALEVRDVCDGNSDVTLWIERPALSGDGNVRFAGVIPGGRMDNNLYLFKIHVRAGEADRGVIDIQDLLFLLNDGEGTETRSTFRPLTISVSEDAPEMPDPPPKARDLEPPESFEPMMIQDPSIADGKHVIAFVTQDKDTGIARYEVFETRRKLTYEEDIHWVETESPYVLGDQELKSFIFVKATDREGNKRIMRIEPTYELAWYEKDDNLAILMLAISVVLALAFVARKKAWRGLKR